MDRFIVVDFETATPARVSACAIGVVVVEDGKIANRFSSLIKPPVEKFAPINVRIHGITADMVRDAPSFDKLYPMLHQVAAGAPIVGYGDFDRTVIKNLAEHYGLPIDCTYIDACKLAKMALPDLANHKLPTVAKVLGLSDFKHHDAAEDAATCAEVFISLLGKCDTIEDARSTRSSQPSKPRQPTRAEISEAFDGFSTVILDDGVVDYKEALELRHFLSALPQTKGVNELSLTIDDFLADGDIDGDESLLLVELIANVGSELRGFPCTPCPECAAPIRRESLPGLSSCPWCGTPLNF